MKKTPTTTEVTRSAVRGLDSNELALTTTKGKPRLTQRQNRVLSALHTAAGWIWRESIDRIARASNGPEVVSQIRHSKGVDVEMERVPMLDADGNPTSPGRYRLTDKGRATMTAWGWGVAQ